MDVEAVPRLADLPATRQRVIRALLSAHGASAEEARRAAAGEMAPDELAEYRERRRFVGRIAASATPRP